MYVHRDVAVSHPMRSQLATWEDELGRPVRVLYGVARGNLVPPPWHSTHKEGSPGFADDQYREIGLTIYSYGALSPINYHSGRYPGDLELFTGRNELASTWHDMLQPSTHDGDTTLIEVDGLDYPIGEVTENCIALFYGFLIYNDFNLEIVKNAFTTTIDPEKMAEHKARRATIVQERFVKYAQRASNAGIAAMRDEVSYTMSQYDMAVRNSARLRVELRQKQKLIDTLLDGDGSVSESQLLDTWATLLDDPRIEDVTFDNSDRLVIITTGLNIVHPTTKQEVYLGKMRWTISVTDSLCTVENLDNARGGYDHPHVYMNNPCFGELGSTIYTLIKQANLWPAVEMIFAFLKSINLNDDWGRRAAFWFEDPMDSPRSAEDPPMEDLTDVDDHLYELAPA